MLNMLMNGTSAEGEPDRWNTYRHYLKLATQAIPTATPATLPPSGFESDCLQFMTI